MTKISAVLLTGVLTLSTLAFGQTPAQWVDAHNKYRRTLVGFDKNPTSSPDLVWSDALARDAGGIYFLRNLVPPLRIAFFDFTTRSISNVAEIPQGILFGTPNLSVSSDERFLLFTGLDQTGSDIMSIENFR